MNGLTYSYSCSSFGCKISDGKQYFGVVYPGLEEFLVESLNLFLRQRLNRQLYLDRLNGNWFLNIKRIIRVVFIVWTTHVLSGGHWRMGSNWNRVTVGLVSETSSSVGMRDGGGVNRTLMRFRNSNVRKTH